MLLAMNWLCGFVASFRYFGPPLCQLFGQRELSSLTTRSPCTYEKLMANIGIA